MKMEKKQMSELEIKEYIRQNMPSMQEIAPQEFQAMVKNGEIMAEKLVAYMHGSLKSREEMVALVAFVAPEVTIEVGAVVVGIVAGEIAGAKAHASVRIPEQD
jgi:hypothetical protein